MDASGFRQLLEGFRKGEQSAFAGLFRELYPGLLYVTRSLVEKELAEEITIDAFMQLFKKPGNFHSIPEIRAYLRITATRDCWDALRSRRSKPEKVMDVNNLEIGHDDAYFMDEAYYYMLNRIRTALDQLPAQQKAVIELAFFGKQKNNEIASQLNISLQTVKNHKSRALDALKNLLTPEHLLLLHAIASGIKFI